MVRNIRLRLAYDGGAYAGWQVQPDQPTLEATLERAVLELTGEAVAVLSAGRTDAGVHALGQVANFCTTATIPPEKWRPALQSRLPADIVVLESREAPLDFHATHSAKSKRYRYVIHNVLLDDPFLRRYAWRIGGILDVAAMHAAARRLQGTHDFRSFESHWPNTAHSVRTVSDAAVFRAQGWRLWRPCSGRAEEESSVDALRLSAAVPAPDGEGQAVRASDDVDPFVCFEIAADGFLYNMVRSIVGTLVNVGRGRWSADAVAEILEAKDRSRAGETAPAHGLYLVSVEY